MLRLLTVSLTLLILSAVTAYSAEFASHVFGLDTTPTTTFDNYALKGGGLALEYEYKIFEMITINPVFGYAYYSVPNYSIDTNTSPYATNRMDDKPVHRIISLLNLRYYFNGSAPAGSWVSLGGGINYDWTTGENAIFPRIIVGMGYKILPQERSGWYIDPYFTYNFSYASIFISYFGMGIKAGYAF